MIPKFDVYDHQFNPNVDPITADTQGVKIVEELERSQNLEWGSDPAYFKADQAKLMRNRAAYKKYKVDRGEELFSYLPQVRAHGKAVDEEERARYTKNLHEAGNESRDTILKDNGDYEAFTTGASSMTDGGEEMWSNYKLRKSMQNFGFSDDEITSGYAEPMLRNSINAGEHEPTQDALIRWSTKTQKGFERRRNITTAAKDLVVQSYLGMDGSGESEILDTLMEKYPGMTADDRTQVRKYTNLQTRQLRKNNSKYRSIVRKSVNTLLEMDEGGTAFTGEGDQPYGSKTEMIDVLSNLSNEEFSKVAHWMDVSVQKHGQDLGELMDAASADPEGALNKFDVFTARWGKRISRGFSGAGENLVSGNFRQDFLMKQVAEFEGGTPLGAVYDKDGEIVFAAPLSDIDRESVRFAIEHEGFDPESYKPTHSFKVIKGNKTERDKAVKYANRQWDKLRASHRIRDWRSYAVEAKSENWAVDNWVYGLAGDSLPEMAALSSYGGMALMAGAQYEENVQRFRRENPMATAEQVLAVSPALKQASYNHVALGRFQVALGFKMLPNVFSQVLRVPGLIAVESATESLQNVNYGVTLNSYKHFYESVKKSPDVDTPEGMSDGDFETPDSLPTGPVDITTLKVGKNDGELITAIKKFPEMMLIMAPIGVVGVGGRAALDLVNKDSFDEIRKDGKLMELYGLDPYDIEQVQTLKAEEAADYIYDNNERFVENIEEGGTWEELMPAPATEANITFNAATGDYSVSNSGQTVVAKSSAEAAEAAQTVDPNIGDQMQAQLDTQLKKSEQDKKDFSTTSNTAEIETLHSFFGPDFAMRDDNDVGESDFVWRERLPPVPAEGKDKVGRMAKKRYQIQKFFSQQTHPTKTLSRIAKETADKIKGAEAQLSRGAHAMDKAIKEHLRTKPRVDRDAQMVELQKNAYYAIRGDVDAMWALPKDVRAVTETLRGDVDFYSKMIAESDQVSDEVAKIVGDNVGSYVFRQFKAFDPKQKWGYNHVKNVEPEIYANSIKEFMDTSVKVENKARAKAKENGVNRTEKEYMTAEEADLEIKAILRTATAAEDFYSGSSTSAKVPVTAFIKQKDLSEAMLALLGEVKNPVINLQESGKKAAKIAIAQVGQLRMAQFLVDSGLASRTENKKTGQIHRIMEETYDFQGFDSEMNPITKKGKRTAKAFSGLKNIWVEPEIGLEIDKAFAPKSVEDISPEGGVLRLAAATTAVGKYAQVILNPASYPTNMLGGLSTEAFNGRISWSFRGTKAYMNVEGIKAYLKDTDTTYGAVEQSKMLEMTAKEVTKAGGIKSLNPMALTTELVQAGMMNNNVIANDLQEASRVAVGDMGKDVAAFFSRVYQIPDNRAKHAALAHELHKHMMARPDETMQEAFGRALLDVRRTTQNYDMVPLFLKKLSSHGIVVPTYISFSSELVRNTKNTAQLTYEELTSGNKYLVKAGMKRAAGMALTMYAVHLATSSLSEFMSGLTEEEQDELEKDANVEPWLRGRNLIFMGAKDGYLTYADPTYIIPQTIWYNAIERGVREAKQGNVMTAFAKPIEAIGSDFAQLNIFTAVSAQLLTNENQYGSDIYNDETDDMVTRKDKMVAHTYKNMFTPGFLRTYAKIKKAQEHEVGFSGSVATKEDLMLSMLSIRPYRKNYNHPKFLTGPLSQFRHRMTAIRKDLNKTELKAWDRNKKQVGRLEKLTSEAAAKKVANIRAAEKRLQDDYDTIMRKFKILDISRGRLRDAKKEARVPKELE